MKTGATTAAESNRPARAAGFTLIELMITIGVAAILAGMAAPSFVETIQRGRIAGDSLKFVGMLGRARSEAMTDKTNVVVCTSNDGRNCSNSDDWENGWVAQSQPPEAHGAMGWDITLRTVPTTDRIVFAGQRPSPGALQDGAVTFVLCDERGQSEARGLILMASGLTVRAVDTDNNFIVNDHNGDDVTCP